MINMKAIFVIMFCFILMGCEPKVVAVYVPAQVLVVEKHQVIFSCDATEAEWCRAQLTKGRVLIYQNSYYTKGHQ